MNAYAGGCLCGAVRYRACGAPRAACFCHCHSCRRASGALMMPWATFAAAQLLITRGTLAQWHSSPGVTRGFCAACGSSLTYCNSANPDDVDIALATLDDPGAIEPQMHVWVEDKPAWVVIGDSLPQYPRGVGTGAAGKGRALCRRKRS